MKKILSSIMVLCMVFALAATAFAADVNTVSIMNEDEADFNLYIDYWNTAEQIYVVNGIEFKVLALNPIMTRGRVSASRTVEMRDLYNDAKLGSVYIYATCVYDGTYVSASSYGSYVTNKPTTSDLNVTGTTVSNNGTEQLSVKSSIAYTGSRGESATGNLYLYVKGDGTYF